MLKDSTCVLLPQCNKKKLQQNRNYAITNTPEHITRTRSRYKNLVDAGAWRNKSAEFSTEQTGSQAQK